ncbi:hypothetical protein AGABI2DRAFT_224842 [Agaricus bisporus var. bisporus H97]|uniref:hypothetical protein n=1 Tax=Agaricus bisporus var. bisporus (strain H97 / ATCC MYA-4626 / FGSC 10389) TaxID=936046 RepID=UPI00029F79BD|nr:hypothetical protein AGABI2DRAFT_224842 [Agaricus bisporus var. bisporus H97]EKV45040.1 hypothetical protein AGABI2DRAFT_224842 [Agaricus bisporus var. bisporus H97]
MLYPTCRVIYDVQNISLQSGGGFCDIHRGRYKGQAICLKVVRLYQKLKVEDLLKAHAREAILWSSLRHPNIVPFHGIYYFQSRQRICLVSPWMGNGDIVDYLERVPEAPRKPFIYDIANGLHYLHSQNVVHGDLKGRNVLIDDHRCACIADFGLSTIVTDETLGFVATTTGTSGHTTRWASPELLEDDARPTTASDIWAFGCVCYEVLAGLSPYAGCSDVQVISKLMKSDLPARLDEATLDVDGKLNRHLRRLVARCWSIEAKARPRCRGILRHFEKHHGLGYRMDPTNPINSNRSGSRLGVPHTSRSALTSALSAAPTPISTSVSNNQANEQPYPNTEEASILDRGQHTHLRNEEREIRNVPQYSAWFRPIPGAWPVAGPLQTIQAPWETNTAGPYIPPYPLLG